jgi:hypothetical protein
MFDLAPTTPSTKKYEIPLRYAQCRALLLQMLKCIITRGHINFEAFLVIYNFDF